MGAGLHVRADEWEGYDVSILSWKLQTHMEIVLELLVKEAACK